MLIFLLLIIILIFAKSKIGKNKEYLSQKQTTSINGIFILLVFYRHISQYLNFNNFIDLPMVILDKYTGQLIVTMFLFYSGYGIMESIKHKKKYIDLIPNKRILKTLLRFDICVILYFIINNIFNKHISISKLALSLLGIESIGNSNWYILAIMVMWLFTYISFKLIKKSYARSTVFLLFLSTIYILIMMLLKIPTYYYNTIICYPVGVLYSIYYNEIEKFYNNIKKYRLSIVINLLLLLLFAIIVLKHPKSIIFYELMSVSFVYSILNVSRHIKVESKILFYLGKNLFPLYILQRIPMIVLKELGVLASGEYLYFIYCFISTIVLTIIYNFILNLFQKKFN